MRFEELGIRTLRQAPANARGVADALLKRAGYSALDGTPTLLGEMALRRMRQAAISCGELFSRLKLPAFATSEDEWIVEASEGPLEMLRCPVCGYAAEVDLARRRQPETQPEEARPLERVRTPNCNTIEDLSSFLGVTRDKTAKAMMYVRPSDNRFIFVVVRGDTRLSLRKLERAVGTLEPASQAKIKEAGAVPGYASPIGLRGTLTVVDELVLRSANLVCGANEPGFHLLNSNCSRDYTAGIVGDFALAAPGDGCPQCGEPLVGRRGHLLADRAGCRYEAILSAAAEQHHDEKGLCLPVACAPFDVHLIQIPSDKMNTKAFADSVHEQLDTSGLSVLYDDREARAGVKFYDADLIGLPVRLTAGERGLRSGMLELKARQSSENTMVAKDGVVQAIHALIELP
jgi:prolyl-tRNA synthetase